MANVHAGDFERLYFDGIAGTPMNNLRNSINGAPTDPNDIVYSNFPLDYSLSEVVSVGLDRVELSGNTADNFGSLIRAYIQAPMDGVYRFSIASDDTSELYISSSESPLDIHAAGNFLGSAPAPAAFETGCCTPLFSGDRLSERTTAPITLQKGKLYYIEIYQKEGGGGAWVQLGWERPDGVKEVIPAAAVFPFIFSASVNFPAASGITVNPADQTVSETQPVTFAVNTVMQPPLSFQWFEGATAIPGATLSYYTIPQTTLAMNGKKYSVTVNGTASTEATLTVQADPNPPTVLSAWSSAFPHGIIITFNKPMDAASMTTSGFYTISGQTLTVSSAQALAPNQVLLKVPDFTSAPMTVKITGVKDATAAGNAIAANTTVNVNMAMRGLALANLFTGLTRGEDGTGASEVARTRALPGYPNSPTWTGLINGVNVPQTSATFGPTGANIEDFQTFVHGFIVPAVSGEYTFYLSSDDPSAFYLSTDDNASNLPGVDTPTLWEDGCCRALGTEADGLNTPITLEAGKSYAFEAYAAEYAGGDYLQVGWKLPGGTSVSVIPNEALATPWSSGALTISQNPLSQTIVQNTPVTFSAGVTGSDPFVIQYQWYRNGIAIPGATASSYSIDKVQVADSLSSTLGS